MTTQTQSKWAIDLSHSEVVFKVKHLMISTVTGLFSNYSAEVSTPDEDFSKATIRFKADAASIQTGNEQRDGHLKGEDFFNATAFPTLVFQSTRIEKAGDHAFTVTGDLTIRDTTKSIQLDVEFNGTMVDPYGQHKAGFEINGKLNRKEFGLVWNATTEAGGIVVSDEVKIHCNIQLVKQA